MAIPSDLSPVTDFMWRTALQQARRRFAFLFLDGGRQAVLEALHPYRNADGGFGNALEPDVRAPGSQPMPTWMARSILDEARAFDAPLVTRICDYLQSITSAEGGIPFVLPSVRARPRAPWWETADQPPADLNPTAAIAALLHKHRVEHPWMAAASDFAGGASRGWSTPRPMRERVDGPGGSTLQRCRFCHQIREKPPSAFSPVREKRTLRGDQP